MALALMVYAQDATNFIVNSEDSPSLFQALCSALLASGLTFVLMWRWFWTRLQGFTGDCLGTTQQLCELAFYLGLALGL
jgi:adenosylcobinamide-GDP ribazoletransferase